MCWECDNPGGDYAAHMLEVIDRFGWGVGGVEPSAGDPGWLHTIGLALTLGHPELLMVIDGDPAKTHAVLNGIAEYIQDTGNTVKPGETMHLGDRMLTFGAISRRRRRAGELASSEEVLARVGITRVAGIEVLPLPAELQQCPECFDDSVQRWLRDGPGAA